jgi:CheY-like chemotaxis protein
MRKPRVIIVDDEPLILHMLGRFCGRRGYEVVPHTEPFICPLYEKGAESCAQAVACADVVITDLKMPKMSGIELLERQTRRGCKLDIRNKAVMSAHFDEDTIKRIRNLGCAYFEKPFRLSALHGWLDECEQRIDFSQPLNEPE